MHEATGDVQCQQLRRQGVQGPDTGQTWVSKDQVLVGSILYVCLQRTYFPQMGFHAQDEATGVRVSAVFAVCATLCRQPRTYTHMYCVCMHMCAY